MNHRDTKPKKIEWLVSCAPDGGRCYDPIKNEHCRRVWYNVMVYGRWYPQYCATYGFEVKDGKKCEMCVQVEKLEALEHIKERIVKGV